MKSFDIENSWNQIHAKNLLKIKLLKKLIPAKVNTFKVIVKSQKLIVRCIYRLPNCKMFFQQFQMVLENIGHFDFIVNLFKVSSMSMTLNTRCMLTNIIKKHIRITDKSKTLIDLTISSNTSKIAHVKLVSQTTTWSLLHSICQNRNFNQS